jgi:signal transduction histidine kinase/CheY-like chemotaxis protein
LVLAPTQRDAELCQSLLGEAGICCRTCTDLAALCRELKAGAAMAVLTEESLQDEGVTCLQHVLADQPPWSDLPLLVLTQQAADSKFAAQLLDTLGNVTLLERPVRVTSLVSAVRSGLRARRRQYQTRGHLLGLKEEAQRKDEFLAMLAHELRNPLAPISNAVEILQLAGGGSHPQISWSCGVVAQQVKQLTRIVDDLLDVSRITRGAIKLQREIVDLTAIVASAIETSRPFIESRRHQLTINLSPESLLVDGDPTRLSQVLVNLLNNAAKYTDPGGQIAVAVERRDDQAVIRVRDSGVGFADELLPKMFDLFVQAERSIDRAQGGLGIGLTIVRSLVEMHGGTVEATSAGPGRGSEFTVTLPLAREPASASNGQALESSFLTGPRHRILIVDDNHESATTMATLLSLVGQEASVAHDGPAAIEAAMANRPDLVLLDIGLPGMDGYQVAQALRSRPETCSSVVAAMTGYGSEKDMLQTKAAGFDYHLVKPVSIERLQQIIGTLPMEE